jgi:hypothetical protein
MSLVRRLVPGRPWAQRAFRAEFPGFEAERVAIVVEPI